MDLEVSGSRLVWREHSPVFSIWTCVHSLRGDECRARLVNSESQFSEAPAVSGATVAWDQFNFWPEFGLGYRANVCRLGAGDEPCSPALAGEPSLSPTAPDVSGDTMVWSSDGPGEPAALFFCERDPVANTCPAQRLTGSAAGARNPAIDGRRVVFEDERDGPTRIYALELPDLLVVGDRRVREGQWLRLAIFGRDPESKHLRLSAQLSGGAPVESLGMRFIEKHGAALLVWRPDTSASGRHAVRFEGEAANGLVTRQTVELIVDDAKPVRR
jgi:beta propeller repeat protein